MNTVVLQRCGADTSASNPLSKSTNVWIKGGKNQVVQQFSEEEVKQERQDGLRAQGFTSAEFIIQIKLRCSKKPKYQKTPTSP